MDTSICPAFVIHVWELTSVSLLFYLFDRLWLEECLFHLIWIALLWESQHFPPGSHLRSFLAFLHLYLLVSYVSIWKCCRNKLPFIILNCIIYKSYWFFAYFNNWLVYIAAEFLVYPQIMSCEQAYFWCIKSCLLLTRNQTIRDNTRLCLGPFFSRLKLGSDFC